MKTAAKAAMREASPNVLLTALVYLLLVTGPNVLVTGAALFYVGAEEITFWLERGYTVTAIFYYSLGGMGATILTFIEILVALYGIIMSYGYLVYAMRVSRRQRAGYAHMLEGFGMAGRVLVLELLQYVFIFLWSLLFVIPGIIAAYRYRMACYILLDDPECGPLEAIRRSKHMMAGHKMELFVFDLSFLNWAFAAIPVAILAYAAQRISGSILPFLLIFYGGTFLINLWLTPFHACSSVNFYASIGGGPVRREYPGWTGPRIEF